LEALYVGHSRKQKFESGKWEWDVRNLKPFWMQFKNDEAKLGGNPPQNGTREIFPWHVIRTVLVVLACVLTTAGCHKSQGTVLGKPPKGEPRSILAVRAGDTPNQVTLNGVMVEKCPVAGCWFRLRDDTGIIKVDTKSAGFAVVNVPLETRVTITGTVVTENDEVFIAATGLRF
jgi:uncharacterized protein YdeI (BOF family)